MNDKELEALSAESNIPKSPIKRGDVNKEIESYLGEDNLKLIRSLTEGELAKLKSYKINPSQSYFVKGSKEKLDKFMAYFLAKCVYSRPSYMKIMLKEYIEGYLDRHDEGTFLLGADKQLLFLYLHKEVSGIGNTDAWIGTSTLDKVANRNRKGLVTVVLSERTFDILEESSEFKVIQLGGATITESVKRVAKSLADQNAVVERYIQEGLRANESGLENRTGKVQVNDSTCY